jgi:hypothetical protein
LSIRRIEVRSKLGLPTHKVKVYLDNNSNYGKTKGKSNAQTLFAMDKNPSDNHIRDLMDVVALSLAGV